MHALLSSETIPRGVHLQLIQHLQSDWLWTLNPVTQETRSQCLPEAVLKEKNAYFSLLALGQPHRPTQEHVFI